MGDFAFLTQAAEDILNRWGMSEAVGGDTIASLVADGAAYWEEGIPSGTSTRALSPFVPTALKGNALSGQYPPFSFWGEAPASPGEQGALSPMVLLDKGTKD